jgi:hypothetical protein
VREDRRRCLGAEPPTLEDVSRDCDEVVEMFSNDLIRARHDRILSESVLSQEGFD